MSLTTIITAGQPSVTLDDTLSHRWIVQSERDSVIGRGPVWELSSTPFKTEAGARNYLNMVRQMNPEKTYRLVRLTLKTHQEVMPS